MNHNTDAPVDSGRSTRAAIGGAAIGTTLAALALALLPGAPATAGGAGDPIHCDRGVCLKYVGSLLAVEDSDGDGFTDADEQAAGSDPKDPNSRPVMLDMLGLVALGGLPSFEKRFSEVVVLPEALPDGTKLGGAADLAALTEALGALAPSRKEGLSRLGISTDLMKEMGVGGSDVLSLVAGARTSKDKPAFEARIGGVNASWISAGGGTTLPPVVTSHPRADGSVRTYVTWGTRDGEASTSFTAQIETTKQGDGPPRSNVTSVTKQSFKGNKADGTQEDVTKEMEQQALTLQQEADNKSKPATPQPAANPASPQPASPASPQPASPASPQPASPAPSSSDEDELAPLAPKPKPSGGFEDPNEVETRVVITRTDVERVVRIVRGSNTTPAQVDVEGPEIDPSEVEDPMDPYAYRDPTHETGTFVTLSPVRTGEANTNFGPGGPLGPR